MKTICFFSSDARPLYKKDVFRVLALPDDYTIHFRYQVRYVDLDLAKLDTYLNKSCVIFFTVGNTLEGTVKNLTNISLREGFIAKIEHSQDTDLIHFYLTLKNFKEFNIQENNPDKLPNKKFVSELEVTDGVDKPWHEIISKVKDSFKSQLMYKISISDKKTNNNLLPQFPQTGRESYYLLEDEKEYILNFSFFDTSDITTNKYRKISIEQSGDYLSLNTTNDIEINALKDNRSYTIFTNSLTSENTFTYLNFSSPKSDSDPNEETYDVKLDIGIQKNSIRSWKFAGYTVLAAISVAYAKIISDKIDLNGDFDWLLTLNALICLGAGLIAAFKLFKLFNKK